jgi:DNA polymerase-1
LNPDQRDYSLGRIVYDELKRQLPDDAAQAAPATWQLAHALRARLDALGLSPVFDDLEMPLVGILAEMEQRGILIDRSLLDVLATEASAHIASLERHIYDQAGTEFNINSPAQLSDILFTRLAIKGKVRRTSGGAISTAATELEKLRDEHPIIESVLEYRELSKLKTTYIDPFPSLIGADGRIRTSYNQTGTATGRLSSSDPNLQNIPTRTELGQRFRAAFVAAPGTQLLSLDYSQLELRLVAHIAQDAVMMEAFRNGEDIHTRTASEVFGLAPAQVTKDMRRQAKVLNFGMIYGMGTLGFARAAGMSRDAAKRFIDEYFTRFAGVARYMETTKDAAFRDGYVSTLLGRRRTLPDVTSRIPQIAAQAERMAINHPIQGTGADLMKLAMIAVRRHLAQRGLTDVARMLLQVHDELVFEVPDAQVAQMAAELRALMEHVLELDVPVVVDAKAGPSWAHQTPITNQ